MKLTYFHLAGKSVLFNLKGSLYLAAIIILLTAVITGSLMTGKSVRNSLKETALEKLGNTGILISSGIRYFDPSLVNRIYEKTGALSTGILEIDGYCQHFNTGQTAPKVKINAIDESFFSFHGNPDIRVGNGEVAINERLADYLQVKQGDELIIRFNNISDIPSDAPFSPGKDETGSMVLKTTRILKSDESGNFSLGISQITPMNLFINRSDINDSEEKQPKINRLLIEKRQNISIQGATDALKEILKPEDTGMSVRFIPRTGGYELISDRIFIDELQVAEIKNLSLKTYPSITYLANGITKGNRSTPYSFISALDRSLYSEIPEGNGIVINKWMADDLDAKVGDTLIVAWYSPDPMNRLMEEKAGFIVRQVAEMQGIWSDSLLMPEFPGIAGSESCTDWDAGVSINTDLIRNKDEEYWNKFRGTPKAFINYEKGRELWGNNFGPATSIRFENDMSENEIRNKLDGSLDPSKSGFFISDLPRESMEAADNSVDFSTLFLSLGFFIILSALILLVLVISTYYESKKQQVTTLFSIGFSNRGIEKLLMLETGITALTGAFAGVFAGGLFNSLIINSLNSVWQGAVQTNTLQSGYDPGSMIIGFITAILIIFVILKVKSSGFLKFLNRPETGRTRKPSGRKNLLFSILFVACSVILFLLSVLLTDHSTMLSFSAGVMVFVSLILIVRHYYIVSHKKGIYSFKTKNQISSAYFSFNNSRAIAPVIFLAAGLFAVIITSVNRMNISGDMLKPTGGTGGYLLWGESSVPVKGNLNSLSGRKTYGLDEPEFAGLSLIQAKQTSGNDASCLNLNHIASPPLLGIDPSEFIQKGSFSFAVTMKNLRKSNPWSSLLIPSGNNTIYGIADQTVMQYGLKIKAGDTLKIRSENGQVLNVIIAAGLKSSVFQGYVLIGHENFNRYFPSISGSQVFLVDGDPGSIELYKDILMERLSEFGIHFESAGEKLSSFFVVTNTYLSVFTVLGGIGMILGVVGLGFMLLSNFNRRKRDFGLMMAAGFSVKSIRKILFTEQAFMLLAGTFTGFVSALVATRPSLVQNSDVPWKTILIMVLLIIITGLTALAVAVRSIRRDSLIAQIRKE